MDKEYSDSDPSVSLIKPSSAKEEAHYNFLVEKSKPGNM